MTEDLGLKVYFLKTRVSWRAPFEVLTGGRIGYIGSFAKDGGLVVGFGQRFGCLTNENFAISAEGLYKFGDLLTRSVKPSYLG